MKNTPSNEASPSSAEAGAVAGQATPRPWTLYLSGHISADLGGEHPRTIAQMVFPKDSQSVIDGKLIINAVNAHKALVAALKRIEKCSHKNAPAVATAIPNCSGCIARAALALVESEGK